MPLTSDGSAAGPNKSQSFKVSSGDGHAAQPAQHASGEASGAEAGADHEQRKDTCEDAELEETVGQVQRRRVENVKLGNKRARYLDGKMQTPKKKVHIIHKPVHASFKAMVNSKQCILASHRARLPQAALLVCSVED